MALGDRKVKRRTFTYDEVMVLEEMVHNELGLDDNIKSLKTLKSRNCICYFRALNRVLKSSPHIQMMYNSFVQLPLREMPKHINGYANVVHANMSFEWTHNTSGGLDGDTQWAIYEDFSRIARWRLRISK